jgi:chaperonin GroEL
MLQDIAILTGARSSPRGRPQALDSVGLEVLGTARRITVTKDDTTIVDGAGDGRGRRRPRVATRSAPRSSTDSDWDREKLQERLAKLAGGVARHQGRRSHRG